MNKITNEKMNAACTAAADMLGISVSAFKRAVFEEQQKEYDTKDIILWLDDQKYIYNKNDVAKIQSSLRDDWDANLDTWSNIASAYYNNDMHLLRGDSIPAEFDIEPSECEAIFPNCQKCKFAHKCSAYQDALNAQDTTSKFFISEDGFSLVEGDDE